jgi:AcrR family transcriptional regulator
MATQSQRRASTRTAILNAAEKLFRKNGFDQTAVEDITSAADVAKGTFYQHFETKLDVLLAMIRRHESATMAEVERALTAGHPPLDLGLELLCGMARQFEKDRKMTAQAIAVAMAHPARLDEPSLRLTLAKILAAAQQLGDIRNDADAYDLALTLVGGMLPHIIVWVHQGKRGTLLTAIENVWRVFLEGARA